MMNHRIMEKSDTLAPSQLSTFSRQQSTESSFRFKVNFQLAVFDLQTFRAEC